MKIIFDSEEEREEVQEKMMNGCCIYDLGLKTDERCCKYKDCLECWENRVEMETKKWEL